MYTGETPVLFLIFNRPDNTYKVFKEIQKAKPRKLYVAADGPRENKPGEKELCQETRQIIQQVDWDCEVHTLFRDKNLGCGKAVSSAITWFFEQVEEGIVLEDDCVPHQSFFFFCQEMLKKYRHDTRVMHICGSNFQFGKVRGDGTYYFSKAVNVWGWASWRRAWQLYDFDIKSYQALIDQNILHNVFGDKNIQNNYKRTFTYIHRGTWDNWDQQWVYAVYANNGLSIVPNRNLISNIGYGNSASAEYYEDDRFINMPREEITELIPPTFMVPDREADEYYHNKVFTHPPLPKRIRRKLRKILHTL